MRIIDCEQGSREWVEARLGRPTASQFSRIVTSTGRLSKSRDTYLAELLCEWVFGEPKVDLAEDNIWIQRGKALEPEARRFYALQHDVEPRRVGLCLQDRFEGVEAGASPDGLVGDRGILELKCPAPDTHLLWLARGTLPPQHRAQVQGQLWVTGREWCDFLSYCPELPPFLLRVAPDPVMQEAFDEHLPAFWSEIIKGRQRLVDLGVKPWEKL